MNERYKTVIIIGYFALGGIGLLVAALIATFRPDATATIINFVGTTLAVASTGAVTFYMLGKQNEKLEKVEQQTNGTLSARDAKIDLLLNTLIKHNIPIPTEKEEPHE